MIGRHIAVLCVSVFRKSTVQWNFLGSRAFGSHGLMSNTGMVMHDDTAGSAHFLGFDRGDWTLFVGGCVISTLLTFLV